MWSSPPASSGSATSTCSGRSTIPRYRGLSLDNNIYVLALLFVFEPLVSAAVFAVVLYVALMVLAALNVASIETPKLGGRWYYVVIGYAVVLSLVFASQLLPADL